MKQISKKKSPQTVRNAILTELKQKHHLKPRFQMISHQRCLSNTPNTLCQNFFSIRIQLPQEFVFWLPINLCPLKITKFLSEQIHGCQNYRNYPQTCLGSLILSLKNLFLFLTPSILCLKSPTLALLHPIFSLPFKSQHSA